MNNFKKLKHGKLGAIDLSRKNGIDVSIQDLVNFINEHDEFITTSSCSGRIIVVSPSQNENSNRKQGCNWIYTSHSTVDVDELCQAVYQNTENAVFKFEPFILHVQCQNVQDAQKMHCAAVAAGFRNSGITIGKKGKIMVAVRSTHGLEVPLADGTHLMVSEEYLHFLVRNANEKLLENETRIKRFHDQLLIVLATAGVV